MLRVAVRHVARVGSRRVVATSLESRLFSTDGTCSKAPVTGENLMHPPFGNYSHGLTLAMNEPGIHNRLLITSGQLATDTDGSIPVGCAEQVCLGFVFGVLVKIFELVRPILFKTNLLFAVHECRVTLFLRTLQRCCKKPI